MNLHDLLRNVTRAVPSIALGLGLAAFAGCNGEGATGTVPEQLEAIEVAGESAYETVEHQGALTVSGSARDFSLEVATAGGSPKLTLHSPGMSDLTQLDGRTVTVTLAPMGLHEERSALITDADGPLYVANVGHGVDADALFGKDFARWGETLATSSDELYDWTYTPAVFKADGGDVKVEPGNSATLKLDGATWRVAVIAAYKVTPHPDAALPCGGISDLLSYEMIRVAAAPEPAKLTRAANAKLAHLGCMADD